MGEMKCIFDIGEKNISILAKVNQVSDVAHGPLESFSRTIQPISIRFCSYYLPSPFWFLFFISSPELKAQVSFSDRPLSVVCLSALTISICELNIWSRTCL
jgi:hypothetical protein